MGMNKKAKRNLKNKKEYQENFELFKNQYPYSISVNPEPGEYIFYKNIIDRLGIERPLWGRFVGGDDYPEGENFLEEHYGFKRSEDFLAFKLSLGEDYGTSI